MASHGGLSINERAMLTPAIMMSSLAAAGTGAMIANTLMRRYSWKLSRMGFMSFVMTPVLATHLGIVVYLSQRKKHAAGLRRMEAEKHVYRFAQASRAKPIPAKEFDEATGQDTEAENKVLMKDLEQFEK